MKCKIYPSMRIYNRFFIAPAKIKVNNLPIDVRDKIGQNKAFKEIDISTEHNLIGLDSKKQ